MADYDAYSLLVEIESVLAEQVYEPCCGWGPLHSKIKRFLESGARREENLPKQELGEFSVG